MADGATADAPPRRRTSWSLRAIVEDVSGKPIGDFQDPNKPVHPYLKATKAVVPSREGGPPTAAPEAEAPYDPVGHLYPPLVGASGRAYHGPENEHHAETLAKHPTVPAGVGEKPRSAGPAHRPERLYLHYLLLHLDRLNDSALAYLRHAVEEEVAHRSRPVAGAVTAKPAAREPETPASAPPLPMPAR